MSLKSLFILLLSLFLFASSVEAKLLPRFSSPARSSGGGGGGSVVVSPKLRGDRRALNVYFGNLAKARSVSYILTYRGNDSDQGAMGSVDVASGSTNRELLFGTCSTSVCTYHQGISNMRLEVTIELTSGKKIVKRYKIKV
ncbi:hypothetical protein HZC27_03860 [Candidatus Roizmanbacteria bacterium]|nr:hypothetical protein [Candidatus Roizmanbacteria bacterium]